MLVLLFSEVHPFGSATADPVAVDIVTSEEVAEKKPEPAVAPEIKPAFELLAPLAPSSLTAAPAPHRHRPRAAGRQAATGSSAVATAAASRRPEGGGAAAIAAAARLRCPPA